MNFCGNETAEFQHIDFSSETKQNYKLEIYYNKESENVLNENFKINICINAIQEEVL